MYEDCIEKFSCNRYPNGCSKECYRTIEGIDIDCGVQPVPTFNNTCPEQKRVIPHITVVEGPAGRDGLDGKDLEFQWIYTDTEIRLAVRVKGTEQWFYSPSLIGPQGEVGKTGPQGDQGPQGNRGPQGAPGINGVSPIIETKANANGFTVEITDAKGKKELQLNHGVSPDIVTTEDAEGFDVEITDYKGKESFKLNHGKSSEIDVEEITGGHKVIIKDKNGTKEILVMDGKDAVSPVIDMSKEDGVITIRVEDAEGVKEESVRSIPEFIGTLENPVDFSDLCKDIEDKDEYTGFCIIGGYFKVTDGNHNDLGVKHWTEIFPGTSSTALNAAESLLVQYAYAKYTGDEYGEIRFGAVVGGQLYILYGIPSLGLEAGFDGGRIATSVDLYNYYRKTETYSKGETDTKISETVANNLTNYYKKIETYSKGETETKIAEAVAELGKLDIEVVDSLPANAETNKIYLVAQDRVNPDVYDEYLYINNAWERIGTTAMSIGTQILNLIGTADNPVDFQELFNAVEKGGSFYLSGYVKCDDNGTSVVKHLSELLTYGTWYDAKYLCNYLIFDQDPKFGYISLIEAMGSYKPRYYRFAIYEESNNQFDSHRQGISLEENSIVSCELVRDKDLYEYVDSALGDVEDLLKEV